MDIIIYMYTLRRLKCNSMYLKISQNGISMNIDKINDNQNFFISEIFCQISGYIVNGANDNTTFIILFTVKNVFLFIFKCFIFIIFICNIWLVVDVQYI